MRMCVDHEMGVGSSRQLYDMLTANYAALFRTSTPLYLDWSVEANFDRIGKSIALKEAFYNLQTEVFWFCRWYLAFALLYFKLTQNR